MAVSIPPLLTALLLRILYVLRGVLDALSDLMFGLVYRGQREPLPPITNLLLTESATSLALKIRIRKVTSEAVVQAFIQRIREVNPILNAVVGERFEEALEEARRVDTFIASGEHNPDQLAAEKPFLGVPFTCKDAIAVKGLKLTAGLVSRKNNNATDDAASVQLLRAAGAIPLAITNVPELLMWWETANMLYGTTKNPYDTARTCGGSSGGEGALLSAAGSPMGLGTDVGGSIRIPSAFNGLFGHKPSAGIVSNDGRFPEALAAEFGYDTTGPMSRFASDLLPMLRVLTKPKHDQLHLDRKVDVQSLRFYYMDSAGKNPLVSHIHPEIRSALRKVINHLDSAYQVKAQRLDIKEMFHAVEIMLRKLFNAGGGTMAEMMGGAKGEVGACSEIIKKSVWMSDHTVPAIVMMLVEKLLKATSDRTKQMENEFQQLQTILTDVLGTDGVMLFPTWPRPPCYHHESLLQFCNLAHTCIFNVLGFPVTAVPLGLNSQGLPLSIEVIANRNNDHLTIAVATELEKAFGGWVSPSLLP